MSAVKSSDQFKWSLHSTIISIECSIEYRIRCSLYVYRDVLVITISKQFNPRLPYVLSGYMFGHCLQTDGTYYTDL